MNKLLLLLFLIISLSQAETVDKLIIKLNSQEISLKEDSKTDEITFYSMDKNVIQNNDIKSCIIEENKRTEKFSLYCTHKNLNTYYAVLEGFVNPDKKFFSYSTFINVTDLSKDIKKFKEDL